MSYHQPDPSDRLQQLAERYGIDPRQRQQTNHPEHQSLKQELAQSLGEAIVTNREQLSIPELTKRLFTLREIARKVPDSKQLQQELPDSFRDVNIWKADQPMGWFRGDGDQAGQHVNQITQGPDAAPKFKNFSQQMRQWGKFLKQTFDGRQGRIIFAGGDDFLGVFYPAKHPTTAVDWFSHFKTEVWHKGPNNADDVKPITPSVGFVWASPQVPQRDVLQHCEQVEQIAKNSGRDRIACRILFSGGNHLTWVCPWWLLEAGLLDAYCDRNGVRGKAKQPNWTHLYNDVAAIAGRHGFAGDQNDVALALFEIYFGEAMLQNVKQHLWGRSDPVGILGTDPATVADPVEALNQWIINLAKVGFHLCSNT